MAENTSRFVIIDGVQIEKARAARLGLIDDKGKIVSHKAKVTPASTADDAQPETPADAAPLDDAPIVDDAPADDVPAQGRARGSASARRG